jgi:uncharacterized oxidoreductase
MKLEGNTILVTGGSSGIGLELAAQLLRRDNEVIVTGRDQAALDAAGKKLPGLHTIQSDVRGVEAIAALHREVVTRFPRMNVLVNNAGVMRKINLQAFDADHQDIAEEIETNLSGAIRMVMQFLPHLQAQGQAAIVNVTSGLAFNPYPIAPVYGATKAGLHSFTQSLRVQLQRTNVKVFELAPPAVDTPLNHTFAADLRGTPLMSVEELVAKALRGMERDRLEICVGFASVSRLMSRLAPGFILKQLSKPVDPMLAQMKQLSG